MSALAGNNDTAVSITYAYKDQSIAVFTASTPSFHRVLLAAKAANHLHVIVDGTLT